MFALINTVNAIPGDSIGTVLSQHRTIEAADREDARLQRAVRRANGENSYLPTRVVRLTRRPAHRFIANNEWEPIDFDFDPPPKHIGF